jgi:hypothetical protein
MLSREMEFTMTTAVVLSEFMVLVGVALISVLAALRFVSHPRPGKADRGNLSQTGAFHV